MYVLFNDAVVDRDRRMSVVNFGMVLTGEK